MKTNELKRAIETEILMVESYRESVVFDKATGGSGLYFEAKTTKLLESLKALIVQAKAANKPSLKAIIAYAETLINQIN